MWGLVLPTLAIVGTQPFHLDENVGLEHMFVVATRTAWSPLEQALARANAEKPSGATENPLALRTRGSVVRSTITFRIGG